MYPYCMDLQYRHYTYRAYLLYMMTHIIHGKHTLHTVQRVTWDVHHVRASEYEYALMMSFSLFIIMQFITYY